MPKLNLSPEELAERKKAARKRASQKASQRTSAQLKELKARATAGDRKAIKQLENHRAYFRLQRKKRETAKKIAAAEEQKKQQKNAEAKAMYADLKAQAELGNAQAQQQLAERRQANRMGNAERRLLKRMQKQLSNLQTEKDLANQKQEKYRNVLADRSKESTNTIVVLAAEGDEAAQQVLEQQLYEDQPLVPWYHLAMSLIKQQGWILNLKKHIKPEPASQANDYKPQVVELLVEGHDGVVEGSYSYGRWKDKKGVNDIEEVVKYWRPRLKT